MTAENLPYLKSHSNPVRSPGRGGVCLFLTDGKTETHVNFSLRSHSWHVTESVQAFDVQTVLFSFPYCLGHDLQDLDFFFFFFWLRSITLHFSYLSQRVVAHDPVLTYSKGSMQTLIETHDFHKVIPSHCAIYPAPDLSWTWLLPSRQFWKLIVIAG